MRERGPLGEWIEYNGSIATVGYTKEALETIGTILWVGLPEIGATIEKGETVVVLESAKAATDCESPLSGKIVEVNTSLLDDVHPMNNAPEETWIFRIES